MVKLHKISLLCVIALLLGCIVTASGQQRTVTGTVRDDGGSPLAGVTVIVQGTTVGISTSADGSFTIRIPSDEAVLEFSYLGYTDQELPVSSSMTNINVVLSQGAEDIEEVVVTGFAVQRKVNVTGAVSTVSGDAILASPVSNITNALVGTSPGIIGLSTSGEPGHNGTDIKIRGVSTYGSSTPLIVIDGVEQASERAFDELNSMDPNEIAGFSILKDASSTAVYGIRGANGVIIVTTKRGSTGKPVINFSSNFGVTMASQLQKGTTSYEYALFRNEAVYNELRSFTGNESLLARVYDDYDLWKFRNNRDFTPMEVDAMTHLSAAQKEALKNSPALYYASHDLYKEQFDKVAPQWQMNVNVSGGTERVKYFASLGYFQQEGITNSQKYYDADTRSNFQRYNFRANFDIDVTKNLKVKINSAGQFGQAKGPGGGNDPWDLGARYKTIMQYIYDANPFISPGMVDGKLINGFAGEAGSAQNPLAAKTASQLGDQNALFALMTSGMNTIYNSLLDNVIKIEHTMDYLLPGLRIYGTLSYQDNYNRRVQYYPSVPSYSIQRNATDPNVYDFFGGSMSGNSFSSWGNDNWNKLYFDAGADWSGSFKDHNISALFLGKGSKYTMPSDSYNVPSGVIGFVGRVTYNYANKYMLEVNAGYNGTEQFKKGNRFGLFPAVSVGWVPTSEAFFPQNDILNFIKIRASYGEVGNDVLGGGWRRFYYLPNTYATSSNEYFLGNSYGPSANPGYEGAYEGALGNPSITWERARKYDVGLELKLLSSRLSIEGDWFHEKRSNILTTLGTILSIYGVSSGNVPPANVGVTKNSGYEITVGWSDRKKDFRYSIEADFAYSHNEIVYRAEAQNPYWWMNATGFSIGQRFGYISDGFYNTEEELANRPYHKFSADQVTLGDIRYKDLNGDGVIDEKDIAPIGYPNYPEYSYNLRLNFGWRGLDIRLLFTGTMNGSYYLNTGYTIPFFKVAGNAWKWQYDGRWTPEKVAGGEKITYPRAVIDATSGHNNYATSDFWMASTDFFKLKNVEVGYTIDLRKGRENPAIQSFRIYANANNIHTFGAKRLKEVGIDPEIKDGSSYIYPLTRVINIGVSLQF